MELTKQAKKTLKTLKSQRDALQAEVELLNTAMESKVNLALLKKDEEIRLLKQQLVISGDAARAAYGEASLATHEAIDLRTKLGDLGVALANSRTAHKDTAEQLATTHQKLRDLEKKFDESGVKDLRRRLQKRGEELDQATGAVKAMALDVRKLAAHLRVRDNLLMAIQKAYPKEFERICKLQGVTTQDDPTKNDPMDDTSPDTAIAVESTEEVAQLASK